MTSRLDFSIGPVQGFVAQSRRTRDLWGSSYLLSFLSAWAMRGIEEAGGQIIEPIVTEDPLYRWVCGHRGGDAPQIGSLPNCFAVDVDGDPRAVANAGGDALEVAWKQVSDAVWEKFVKDAFPYGAGTQDIWTRQTRAFWEINWTAGSSVEGGRLLARRKHWRRHRLPDEPGDKCTVMHDLQELSGHIRSKGNAEEQDQFWEHVRRRTGRNKACMAVVASMRPGQEGPGYSLACWDHARRRQSFNEAGARRPRIQKRKAKRKSSHGKASMRPGQEGPGYLIVRHYQDHLYRASMRPGQEGPGYTVKSVLAGALAQGFNEAGARRPRIRPDPSGAGVGMACFNEAGARRPRIGSGSAAATAPPSSFNEAGARRPRIQPRRIWPATS